MLIFLVKKQVTIKLEEHNIKEKFFSAIVEQTLISYNMDLKVNKSDYLKRK